MIGHARPIRWGVLILTAALLGCGMRLTREKEQLPRGYFLFFPGGTGFDVAICDEADNTVVVDPQIVALAIVDPFVLGRRVNYPHDKPQPEYFVLDTSARKLNWFADHTSMQQYFNLRGLKADFEWAVPRVEARRWRASR